MSGADNPAHEPRGAASLTAGLLARRGAARPAMRRQPIGTMNPASLNEDLGWNDMGTDLNHENQMAGLHEPAPMPAPTPTNMARREPEPLPETGPAAAPVSPIAQQIAVLAERIGTKTAAPEKNPPRAAELPGASRKAAFTLRLDTERHLRLRLMSALSNRSAQHLLIEALDALIARDDELKALADQVEARKATATRKLG